MTNISVDTNTAARTEIALSTTVTGSGPAIVLAHGAGGGIQANFGSLIPLLAPHHKVIGSDYPADSTPLELDALADALVAAALAAGVTEFTMVAYSLGTAVAVRAAVRHPDRIRGLVLAAGFARPDNQARLNVELWQSTLAAGDHDAFARVTLLAGFSTDFVQSLTAEQLDQVLAQTAANIPGGTAAQAALVETIDTTADLAQVSVPTLVIGARGDKLVDVANSRQLAAAIPGAEYAEIEAGHVLMLEQPDRWHTAVLDFLHRQHEKDRPRTESGTALAQAAS